MDKLQIKPRVMLHDRSVVSVDGTDGWDAAEHAAKQHGQQVIKFEIPGMHNVWQMIEGAQ